MDQFEKQKFIMIVESVILNEMPIKTKLVGNFTGREAEEGGFDDTDRKLLTNPKAIEKITKQWERTKFNFDVYMLNKSYTNSEDYQEIGPIDLNFLRTELKISPNEIPDPNPDSITIIFNGNFGDQKVPMTGWTIAHRFGHVMNRDMMNGKGNPEEFQYFERELTSILRNILGEVYGIYFTKLFEPGLGEVFQQIGTMKSARDKKLNRGYEFVYELIAQYLLTGTVKLQLPKTIKFYGDINPSNRHALEMYKQDLPSYEENIVGHIENLIGYYIGKILLM
jgi:hypothetical protein